MTKKEIIWREILYETRANHKNQFMQKELAQKFGISVSTVFNALKAPRDAHALRVTGRFFVLEDYRRLLYLWASERNIKKDIYFRGYSPKNIAELEGLVPPEVIFGLYSGFKFLANQAPAEYDHLYIYVPRNKIAAILERFDIQGEKTNKQPAVSNVFLLEPDVWLSGYPHPLFEQIFVDIWNAPEWYAKDFLRELETKIS